MAKFRLEPRFVFFHALNFYCIEWLGQRTCGGEGQEVRLDRWRQELGGRSLGEEGGLYPESKGEPWKVH